MHVTVVPIQQTGLARLEPTLQMFYIFAAKIRCAREFNGYAIR